MIDELQLKRDFRESMARRYEISRQLFGDFKTDDQIISVARAFVAYIRLTGLADQYYMYEFDDREIEIYVKEDRISGLMTQVASIILCSKYHAPLDIEDFQSFRDQQLAEAAYVPHLSSDDDADEFSL